MHLLDGLEFDDFCIFFPLHVETGANAWPFFVNICSHDTFRVYMT